MTQLITLPIRSDQDDALAKIVATYLCKRGVSDISALPTAITLLAALQQYLDTPSLEQVQAHLRLKLDRKDTHS